MAFMCIVCRELVSKNPFQEADRSPIAGAAAQVDIVATKCGHVYHLTCLEQWFNTSANPRQTCPHCQSRVNARDYQRLFLVGDEEADDIEKLQKEMHVKNQQSKQLETVKIKLETELKNKASRIGDKSLMFDILNEDYKAKLEELQATKVELEELRELWESAEVANTEHKRKLMAEKTELEEKMVLLQTKNNALEEQLVEAKKTIDKLKTENALQAEQKLVREELTFSKLGRSNSSAGSTFRGVNPVNSDMLVGGNRLGNGSLPDTDGDIFSRKHASGRSGLLRGTRPESASSLKRSATVTSNRSASPMLFDEGSNGSADQLDVTNSPTIQTIFGTTTSRPSPFSIPDGVHSTPTVLMPTVKKNSMAVQTDKIHMDYALQVLDSVEPLSLCIKVLEDERRKKENSGDGRKELRGAVGGFSPSGMNGLNGNHPKSVSGSQESSDSYHRERQLSRGASLFD